MPKTIRYTLLSLRDLWVSAGPFILLAVALLALAYWWLDPNPPKRVTLATGPAQSAYEEFGKRYARALAAEGIQVVLHPSEGSAANLQLLREGKVDVGFVQGGTSDYTDQDEEDLASLGSLFVEPLWLFYREDAARKESAMRWKAMCRHVKCAACSRNCHRPPAWPCPACRWDRRAWMGRSTAGARTRMTCCWCCGTAAAVFTKVITAVERPAGGGA